MTPPVSSSSEALRAAVERDAERLAESLCAALAAPSGPAAADRPSTGAALSLQGASGLATVPESGIALTPLPIAPSTVPTGGRRWERWLFLGAAGFLAGTLAWFWQGRSHSFPQPEPPAAPVEHQSFIAHLQETLDAIERDERHARQLAAAKAERQRIEQERAERDRQEREKAELAAAAAAAAIPPSPPPAPVVLPPIVVQATPAPPAPPPQPVPAPSPEPLAAAATTPPAPAAPPPPSVAIIGSMEIGDRAVALVEIDGRVERYVAGESLPGTDWSVANIAPRQVVLRDRAGRERAIAVGGRL